MSRGENQSRKKTAGVAASKIGVDAVKTDAIKVHRSASDTKQKISANGNPAERSAFKPNPGTIEAEKKQFAELREKNLAPQETQALLSMAMEISRMGAWEIDRGSGAVYWSPELEEIFGLEPGGFAGTRSAFYDLVHEQDRERILAEIENAVREQRAYSIEFRFYHSDGSLRWMEGRGEAVYSEKGEPVRLYGVGIDITDRKKAEEALIESERRFAEFMQNLPGLAWIKDKDGRYVFVNDTAEETFGLPKAELYGKTDDEIFPPETAAQFKKHDQKALEKGSGIQAVERLRHKDGILHHSIVSKFPISGPSGNSDLVGGVAIDITEREKAVENLRESEQQYQALVHTSAQVVWTTNAAGEAEEDSPTWREFTGQTYDEWKGHGWLDVFHPDDRERVRAEWQTHIEERKPIQIEYRVRHKSGNWRWMAARGAPIFAADGTVQKWVGMNSDITARKGLEQQVEGQNEVLKAVALARPLEEILDLATASIEKLLPDSIGSVLLANDTETQLFTGSAKGLPDEYNAAIDGVAIGESMGSCGTAAFRREPVIVTDIQNDPLWKDFRNLAREYKLAACWSHPILSPGGTLLGTFATYFREPREARPAELDMLRSAARVAGIALERKRAEDAIARTAAIVRSSDDAIISKTLDGVITTWNEGAERLFGYRAQEAVGKPIAILIPPDRLDEELQILERLGRGEHIEHFETVRMHKDGTALELSLTISPVKDVQGRIIGASKIARDITERRNAEKNQAFLFEIAELIRQAENAEDLLYTIAATTGKHFQVSRCLFNEIDLKANRETINQDYFDGVGSAVGVHRLTDYSAVTSAEMANGKTVVNFDSKTDERTAADYERSYDRSGERSYVAVPLLRSGRWVASLWISDDNPRFWSPQEVGLLETVAERTWLAVEKLRSERSLRESEEQYRTLFDLVPVAVYTCDAEGVIQAYNQNAVTLWGREPKPGERFCGSPKIYYPDGRPMPHDTCPMARILRGETVPGGEDEILVERQDGARKVAIALPKLLKDEHGNITGAINCLYDVTELKIAQRELIRSERRAVDEYQALLQHIVPLGQKLGTARDLITIYRAVHDFIRSSMNCSAFFVSFYSPQTKLRTAAYAWGEGEEIEISMLPPMPITPDGGSNSRAILNKKTVITNRYWDTMKTRPHVVLMENGIDPMSSLVVPMMIKNAVIGTLEVQAHDDEAFTVEHVVALEMVANLAAVAIENVRLLDAQDKARQEAESANRTKDEFLSVLSHELRTPLNSMMGWIRMLRQGNLDADHTAKAIEVIDRNTRVQSSLIEDLLDVSRIISGKMRVEKELTDLAVAVRTATEAIRPMASAKNIGFEVDAGTEPLFADGDPVRLQQVVTNLVQNAIKFTPEYGNIEVSIKRLGRDAIIAVRDSGIGIEEHLLPSVFERFRQGDASTKRGFAGLGLGLTIVRTIVELHGGEIKAQSDGKDRGTLFTITLPLSEVLYAEDSEANGDKKQPLPDGELDGIGILLVDDDLDSVKPLLLFLEGQKASVVSAASAMEAMQKLADRQFDVLITDIGMPGIDGFELVSKLRNSTKGNGLKLPAIAVTAYASPGDRERALAAGFQVHMAKPIDYDALLSAVKSVSRQAAQDGS